MTANPPIRLFDRANLVPGLHVGRRANADVSKGILLATGIRTEPIWKLPVMGYDPYIQTIIGLTHDAMIVRDPETGRLMIGDALGGKVGKCILTPIEEWERGCIEENHRIIIGRPANATNVQLEAAAKWWIDHIAGKPYDKVALAQLLAKAAVGDLISYKVGLYSHFFCTEGVQESYEKGALDDPYWPNKNGTPGTTTRRYKEGRMVIEANAITPEGMKYLVALN